MGSVKDLVVTEQPTQNRMGYGTFHFSDRYSVFDWGEMPDHIANKGAALCAMSAYFFEALRRRGVFTHYIGVGNDGRFGSIERIIEPPTQMHILLSRVLKPEFRDGEYGYSAFQMEKGNFVIPLEVIYRNSLPKGSSVFRRLREGSLTLGELGLSEMPPEGFCFPKPFVDGSTKYEEFDRYPGWEALQRISGLTDPELEELKEYVLLANEVITEGVARAGFVNEDGKFEFAFNPQRRLALVDTVGTLDECRFTYSGVDASKQIPRDYYKAKQPEWVVEIDAAKKRDKKEWKRFVKAKPEPLPASLREILENLYPAVANAVLDRQLFAGMPFVDEVIGEYERFKTAEMS